MEIVKIFLTLFHGYHYYIVQTDAQTLKKPLNYRHFTDFVHSDGGSSVRGRYSLLIKRYGQWKCRKHAGLRAPCDFLRLDSKGMAPTHAYSWTVATPSDSRLENHRVVHELHIFPTFPLSILFFA